MHRRFVTGSRIVSVALAAALTLASGCGREGEAKMPPATGEGAPPLPEVPDVTPGADTAAAATSTAVTGTLYPVAEAHVATKVAGTLSRVAVEEGDQVKKGALLFQVDAADAALRRDAAAAQLKAAQVNLRAIEVELERSRKLLAQNALNQAQFDQILARHEGAMVGVEQARIALAMAKKAVADTAVRAPIAGTVVRKLMSTGEAVSSMPPSVVVSLADYGVVELRFRVAETELPRLSEAQTVQARFAALDAAREAKIQRINPTVDPATRTVEVVATIDNAERVLKPGMLAEITLGERTGTAVPPAGEAAGQPAPPAESSASAGARPAQEPSP